MYGCDPWKDKKDAIERRLDELENRNIDHDQSLLDMQVEVDNDRAAMQAYASAAVTNGAFNNALMVISGELDSIQDQIDNLPSGGGVTPVTQWSAVPSDDDVPSEKLVKTALDGKVSTNAAITAGTKCKITYDSKGLVTKGEDLADTDIPSLATTKITGLDTALTNINTAIGDKVTGNSAISGATKCKITYDSKGLVTAGADLTDIDIPSLATSKITGLDTAISDINTAIINRITRNTAITAGTKCKITYDAKGLVTAGADLADTDIPNGIERTSNKVSSFSETPTDTNYPSEKLVKDTVDGIQEQIDDLPSGGGVTPVTEWSETPSDDDVPSEKLVKDTFGDYLPLAGGVMSGSIKVPATTQIIGVDAYTDRGFFVAYGSSSSLVYFTIRANEQHFKVYRDYCSISRTRPIATRGNDDVVVWGNIVDLMAEESGIATLDNTGKVPSAQLPTISIVLYEHNITVNVGNGHVFIKMINRSNTPYTFETLKTYLTPFGIEGIVVSGSTFDTDTVTIFISMKINSDVVYASGVEINKSNGSTTTSSTVVSNPIMEDIVIEL